jgi:hypothetical protein
MHKEEYWISIDQESQLLPEKGEAFARIARTAVHGKGFDRIRKTQERCKWL